MTVKPKEQPDHFLYIIALILSIATIITATIAIPHARQQIEQETK